MVAEHKAEPGLDFPFHFMIRVAVVRLSHPTGTYQRSGPNRQAQGRHETVEHIGVCSVRFDLGGGLGGGRGQHNIRT